MTLGIFKEIHDHIGRDVAVEKGCLDGTVECSSNLISLLKQCDGSPHFRIEDISLNGAEISLEKLTPSNSKLSLSLKILESDDSLIYKDLSDMLSKRASIHRGECINEFHLWDDKKYEDIYLKNSLLGKLESLCKLIAGLAELAHYHDNKSETDRPNYVFVNESDVSAGRPLVIETQITEDMLENPQIDVSVFDDFSESSTSNKNPNIGRERSVFRATLIEFVRGKTNFPGDEFNVLVHGWNEFLALFQRNFETYISGFAFHKARKDVADAELSIASELSKIMGEIGGKILGIPISLVAIIPMITSDSILEGLIICIGLLFASAISSQVIFNQQNQLSRVWHAKSVMFPSGEFKGGILPDFLNSELKSASRSLDDNYARLNVTLWFFRVLCWFPVVFGIFLLAHKYSTYLDFNVVYFISSPALITIFLIKNKWARLFVLGRNEAGG